MRTTILDNADSQVIEQILPYLPLPVELEDIKYINSNVCFLLGKKEIAAIKIALRKKKDGRYGKRKEELKKIYEGRKDNKPTASYSIIKQGNKYYAIYKGVKHHAELGQGAFGTVKLAQDLDTGEWVPLKIQSSRAYQVTADKNLTKAEYERLKILKRAMGSFKYTSVKKGCQYSILMKMAQGRELQKFCEINDLSYQSKRLLPAAQWLQIAINICGEVDRLHERYRLIHRDIKLANLMYDHITGKITIVDFGLSCELPTRGVVDDVAGIGSPFITAPESGTRKQGKNGKYGQYSIKSDVYAVGITIANMLGFLDENNQLIHYHHPSFNNADIIKNTVARTEILAYLHLLTHTDPNMRPTLRAAQSFFKKIQDDCLLLPSKLTIVGLLNVAEYERAWKGNKHYPGSDYAKLLKALKRVDSVMLVNTRYHPLMATEYLAIKKELEQEKIVVSNQVFLGEDLTDTISRIPRRRVNNMFPSPIINTYAYVTNGNINLPNKEIEILQADHMSSAKYQQCLARRKDPMIAILPKLEHDLNDEIRRLGYKYSKGGRIKSEVIKERIRNIEETILSFKEQLKHEELDLGTCQVQLLSLQNKMIRPKQWYDCTFLFFQKNKSTGEKKIATIRENVGKKEVDSKKQAIYVC